MSSNDEGAHEQGMYASRPELEQLSEQRFAFLASNKGWSKGRIERNAFTTSWYYMPEKQAPKLALQVMLDFRDESVDVNLVKLENGKVPKQGYYKNDKGVIRRSLDLLLRDDLHIKDDQLETVFALLRTRKPWHYSTVDALLQAYQDLVESYIALVLQQPFELLFPLRRNQ